MFKQVARLEIVMGCSRERDAKQVAPRSGIMYMTMCTESINNIQVDAPDAVAVAL